MSTTHLNNKAVFFSPLFSTHLIRLHLQAGRGLIEHMIPPVEGELLPFLVTNLMEKSNIWLSTKWWSWEQANTQESSDITHPAFVAFYFDLDGLWDAILGSAQSFTCGQRGQNK